MSFRRASSGRDEMPAKLFRGEGHARSVVIRDILPRAALNLTPVLQECCIGDRLHVAEASKADEQSLTRLKFIDPPPISGFLVRA
jgi:hypothetical protein